MSTYIQNANFQNVNFQNVNFQNVNFQNVDFQNVDFQNVKKYENGDPFLPHPCSSPQVLDDSQVGSIM
jgi:pectate lyase